MFAFVLCVQFISVCFVLYCVSNEVSVYGRIQKVEITFTNLSIYFMDDVIDNAQTHDHLHAVLLVK